MVPGVPPPSAALRANPIPLPNQYTHSTIFRSPTTELRRPINTRTPPSSGAPPQNCAARHPTSLPHYSDPTLQPHMLDGQVKMNIDYWDLGGMDAFRELRSEVRVIAFSLFDPTAQMGRELARLEDT